MCQWVRNQSSVDVIRLWKPGIPFGSQIVCSHVCETSIALVERHASTMDPLFLEHASGAKKCKRAGEYELQYAEASEPASPKT